MAETKYDLIVIGAGPGGYVAAIRAAQLGMKVCCIDKNELGGTCLNIGCIPSKALLDSSEHYYETRHSFAEHGIQFDNVKLDLAAMLQRKDKIVKGLTGGVSGLFRKNKIDKEKGAGKVLGAGKVEVDTGKEKKVLQTERILIATGSVPVELPFMKFDGKGVISSTEALSLPKVPEKMAVIGAGAVGLELGSVWSRLGADVLVIEMQEHIIPGMDFELTDKLQKILEKQGLKFALKSGAKKADVKKGKVALTYAVDSKEEVFECDHVLVAVGRKPFTAGLGLEEAGVKTNERGYIPVNHRYETSVSGIYAIGDVIPGVMLAHKAEEEGIAAVELMAGKAGHVNYDAIPNVVYTHPELASVGITEQAAKEQGLKYKVGKFPFSANGRAMCLGDTSGVVKIIADERTDKMLGMHILAPRASDMIAEGAVAMEFHSSAEDIALSVHAHPTLPEAVKEAALAVAGRAIHF